MHRYEISNFKFVGTLDEEALNRFSQRLESVAETMGDEAQGYAQDRVSEILGEILEKMVVFGGVDLPAFMAYGLPLVNILEAALPEVGIPNDTSLQMRINEFVPSRDSSRIIPGTSIKFFEPGSEGNFYEEIKIKLSGQGTTDRSIAFVTPVAPVIHIHLSDVKTKTTLPQNINATVPLGPCSQCYIVGFSRLLDKSVAWSRALDNEKPAPPSLLMFDVHVTETTTPATFASICRVPESFIVHWTGRPVCLARRNSGPNSVVLETGSAARDTSKLNLAAWKIDPGLRGVPGMTSIYQTLNGKIYELCINDQGLLDITTTYGTNARQVMPLWKIDPDPSGYSIISWVTPKLNAEGIQAGWTYTPLRKLYISDNFVADRPEDYTKFAGKNEVFKRDSLWRIAPARM